MESEQRYIDTRRLPSSPISDSPHRKPEERHPEKVDSVRQETYPLGSRFYKSLRLW